MTPPAFTPGLLHPRYWPAWIAMGLLWCMAKLPWVLQYRIGECFGWLAWHLVHQRRTDTLVNLQLCFPEKSEAERIAMARDTFRQAGIGVFETANAWFIRPEYYRHRITFEGLEHLRAMQERGHGILLLGAHYTFLDLGAAMASLHFKVDTVYRPQKNAVLEYVMTKRRQTYHHWTIPYRDMRRLIRALKDSHIVWYTPDQDFGRKQSVFAPFFGVPAATISTPSRLAAVNDAAVMLIHFCRDGHREHYHFRLSAPLDHFPAGDEVADATRINRELEALIRHAPTQYLWSHRRFKTRPEGLPEVYPPKSKDVRRRAARAAAARARTQS